MSKKDKDRMDIIVPYPKVSLSAHTHIFNDNAIITNQVNMLREAKISEEEFKGLVRNITKLLATEAFANLPLEEHKITTPICKTLGGRVKKGSIVLVPILRAGLGMEEGLCELMPCALHGRVGLSRDEDTLTPTMYLWDMPEGIEDREIFVLDPMLATGGSASYAISRLRAIGCKGKITLISIVAAPRGIDTIQLHHPDVEMYIAHLDEGLNRYGFIVPGLGDAGDRMFGPK